MSWKTVALNANASNQALTGSWRIRTIRANPATGGIIYFYDAADSNSVDTLAATVRTPSVLGQTTRTVIATDAQGNSITYNYDGSQQITVNVAAGNIQAQPIWSTNQAITQELSDVICSRGLLITASGAAATVQIEYLPNIANA